MDSSVFGSLWMQPMWTIMAAGLGGWEGEQMKKVKVFNGIVRHYWNANGTHASYRGRLKEEDDLDSLFRLEQITEDLPDGFPVRITIEVGEEQHPSAKGFRYQLTQPHTYERVPIPEGQP